MGLQVMKVVCTFPISSLVLNWRLEPLMSKGSFDTRKSVHPGPCSLSNNPRALSSYTAQHPWQREGSPKLERKKKNPPGCLKVHGLCGADQGAVVGHHSTFHLGQ